MDPKVYGELITHHERGHGVDEEALRIRIPPSGRAPERAPDGILRRQKLAAAEK